MENHNLFEPPDMFTARRILAVQPHYDDNDISAGGTLASLVENGAKLYYLTVTNDLVGVIDQSLSDEAMTRQLQAEQIQAGEQIGVAEHIWLGYPDAGKYDYFAVRRQIIKHIRRLRPDFIFTCDPWMPYEAHNDHILTGRAAAEAAILFTMMRLETDADIDAAFRPYDLTGVVFYNSAYPNTTVDISQTRQKKHRAIDAYKAQFDPSDMAMLHAYVDLKEQEVARDQPYTHGEAHKVLRTLHLHGFPQAMNT